MSWNRAENLDNKKLFIMRRESTILLSFLLGFCIVNAQQSSGTSYPTIGKLCPDFVLHNINYYKQGQAKLADFKGKWLILDFFTSSCGGCIASFPKVGQQAKQFADKLTYMMVGSPDNSIGPLYARLREKLALPMPCSFDHGLFERWGIHAVPRVYLIDDQGVVRSISSGLTAGQISGFLEGKTANGPVYNSSLDSSMLYGSAISSFQPKLERFTDPVTVTSDGVSTVLDCKGAMLEAMLNYAFWGDMWPAGSLGGDSTFYLYSGSPILETTDSLLFKFSYSENRNIFDYTLRLRGAPTQEVLRQTMRDDLCRFFAWSVSVEFRPIPCLKLVAKAGAAERLRTKGGIGTVTGNQRIMDYSALNSPFRDFYAGLCGQLPNVRILDETGISGNVDLSVKGPWVSVADAQAGLRPLGLDLVPDSVSVKVLVVKDRDTREQGVSSAVSRANSPKPLSFEEISWQTAVTEAKAENKLIMVYCYESRNETCQWMDSNVFSAELLGDYLNGRVVALKYRMDSGDEVGQRVKAQYEVKEYPTLLFFSPEGRPLNLAIGFRDIHGLINLVAKSANPKYQYYTWLDEYHQGKRDSAFLYDLAKAAMDNRQAVSQELVRNYLHWFILPAPPTLRWNKDNMELLSSELNANNDTALASLIYDNRSVIDAVNHDQKLAEDIIRGWVIFRYTTGQVTQEGVPVEPDWRQIEEIFKTSYPAIDYHKRLLEKQWGWYKDQKDWGKFEKYVARFMDEYAVNMDAGELSDRAWDIFLYCDDPRLLAKAVGWARTALEKSHHSPDMLETYAELLYKTHSKEDYLSMEQQVADGDPNNKLVQAYYQKMKKGEPTWVR
jgi:thiol-disulfide isomerase/thioredoxin